MYIISVEIRIHINILFPLWHHRTLAVGAKNYKLAVTVKNEGDDAYNAKLFVTIPKGIKIGKIFSVDKEVSWLALSALKVPSV